jgi:hypothetical protein
MSKAIRSSVSPPIEIITSSYRRSKRLKVFVVNNRNIKFGGQVCQFFAGEDGYRSEPGFNSMNLALSHEFLRCAPVFLEVNLC